MEILRSALIKYGVDVLGPRDVGSEGEEVAFWPVPPTKARSWCYSWSHDYARRSIDSWTVLLEGFKEELNPVVSKCSLAERFVSQSID